MWCMLGSFAPKHNTLNDFTFCSPSKWSKPVMSGISMVGLTPLHSIRELCLEPLCWRHIGVTISYTNYCDELCTVLDGRTNDLYGISYTNYCDGLFIWILCSMIGQIICMWFPIPIIWIWHCARSAPESHQDLPRESSRLIRRPNSFHRSKDTCIVLCPIEHSIRIKNAIPLRQHTSDYVLRV